jgi:riboflavin kinase/FMN adenylyltransferase
LSLKIIKGIDLLANSGEKVVSTIGTFDGLHRGHQAILDRLKQAAQNERLAPLAITFEPHPRVLVTPETPPPLLTVWEEKVRLFSKYIDGSLLVLEFNRNMMNMTAEEFTRTLLVERINLKKLIVGYDHAFGKNRSGTINDLMELSRKYSFDLEIVNPIIVDGKPISSSRIRRLMTDRNYVEALNMLGHPYPIYGRVIKGIGLGRKLGYPTANLEVNPRKLLPPEGVYSCSLELGERKFAGMMFIGKNHFNPQAGISVEVNIFDFDEEIYEQEIFCYPEIFLRENRVFDEPTQLTSQIKIDKDNVVKLKNKGENRNVC